MRRTHLSGLRFVQPPDLQVPSPNSDPRDRESIAKIRLCDIQPAAWQPRHHFDEGALEALAEAIRPGLLHPIVVRKHKLDSGEWSGRYELIVGERRWRAAQLNAENAAATPATIEARVIEADDFAARRMTLVENEARVDKSPWEVATAYRELKAALQRERSGTVTQAELATMTPHAESTVNEYLQIAEVLTEDTLRDAGFVSEDGQTDYRAVASVSRKRLLKAAQCADPEVRSRLLSDAKGGGSPRQRGKRWRSTQDREVHAFLRMLASNVARDQLATEATALSRPARAEIVDLLRTTLEVLDATALVDPPLPQEG
jgi:ParB/RepB/Spo0J family partition protein